MLCHKRIIQLNKLFSFDPVLYHVSKVLITFLFGFEIEIKMYSAF